MKYGPGDPETWGPVVDPRDPRYEEWEPEWYCDCCGCELKDGHEYEVGLCSSCEKQLEDEEDD